MKDFWVGIMFGVILGIVIGGCMSAALTIKHLKLNDIRDYHCAPIVKASTMEEAIKQVEINQAITGVREL